MFFVLLLKTDPGNAYPVEAYQVTEGYTGQAPVVFRAETLADCISWLEAEGGNTWQYQKLKIRWFTMQIGAKAVWHFQEALQQPTGWATYEATAAQNPELDLVSYDHTRRLLNGWSYDTLKLIEDHLDHAYDRMIEADWQEKQAQHSRKQRCKPLKRKQWSQ